MAVDRLRETGKLLPQPLGLQRELAREGEW